MTRESKSQTKQDCAREALRERSTSKNSLPDGDKQKAGTNKEDDLDPAYGKVRVFVYGSLKQQCGNHILLQQVGAKCLGYDSITGDFSMMSFGGFPGVVRTDEQNGQLKTIFGELYAINEEGLASLDVLESHPNWYERRKYRTDVLDYRAWMYTLPGGEGYLDATRYQLVDTCIWRPKEDEIEFWDKYNGITSSGD